MPSRNEENNFLIIINMHNDAVTTEIVHTHPPTHTHTNLFERDF